MTLTTLTNLDGLVNFRDVGGMPAGAGTIATGVLYRSDGLASLSDEGRRELADCTIGTVVDFRSESEVAHSPGLAPDSVRPALVSMPLLDGAVPLDGGRLPTLDGIYLELVQRAGDRFARLASIIATSDDAVLVHCTAGKDRTGVGVALVLLAVGADRDAVTADYLATSANLTGAWSERMFVLAREMGVEITPELEALVNGTSAEALGAALDWVEQEHGSVDAYLLAHGLGEDELVRLRERLTVAAV
ncbi:hypothetical protein ASE14_15430 [Agromyces sp. Root81]|uniref:tyrosine-protein phosphatase n=1 Tax=Agromyces sp. Root81 TaxID=1736601 RepID=UPI0006FD1331|nr:tyrosine-protein phosphatase [Agromyces sp. Root81]KRC59166.1 hypothetical protein ASE14_15430 [Agromyces sp. Root81]